MRLHVDQEADALYLRLDESVILESKEVSPGVVLDYNAENQVVGVEILHLSKRVPNLEPGKLVFETTPALARKPSPAPWTTTAKIVSGIIRVPSK
jgi:uncharacterized protein YuzE